MNEHFARSSSCSGQTCCQKVIEIHEKIAVEARGYAQASTASWQPGLLEPETIKNFDQFKQLERKLYFQGGAPADAERDQILESGKAVVLVTYNIHATEIGSSQIVLELVHRIATEDSPLVKKILDNVIFRLVPSLNPDAHGRTTTHRRDRSRHRDTNRL